MRLYVALILLIVFIAFGTGYSVLLLKKVHVSADADVSNIINFKSNFQDSHKPLQRIDLTSLYQRQNFNELIDPQAALPRTFDYPYEEMKRVFVYSKNCTPNAGKQIKKSSTLYKEWLWRAYMCGQVKQLPADFFDKPPFMDPWGHSYIYLAFVSKKPEYLNNNWIKTKLNKVHIKELAYFTSLDGVVYDKYAPANILKDMDNSALKALSKGENPIVSDHFILFLTQNRLEVSPEYIYDVFDKKEFDDFLKQTQFITRADDGTTTCALKEGNLCFFKNISAFYRVMNRANLLLLAASIMLIFVVLWILVSKMKSERVEQERRNFALQVMTHELRTPITSIMLILDQYKKHFDSLDTTLQENTLYMLDEVQRLKKLVETSTNYLKSSKKNLIEFRPQGLPSINEFIRNSLDSYGSKVKFTLLKKDSNFYVDAFWFNLCIKNLVENALAHGKPPVKVLVESEKDYFNFVVEDKGICEFKNIEQMTQSFVKGRSSKGTGLGLSIVENVIHEIGGKLFFSSAPTRFTIQMPKKVERT